MAMAALAGLILIAGCNPAAEKQAADVPSSTQATTAAQAQAPQGGSGEGVRPLVPGAGAVSPIVGTESVQGGGSAVGSVMKDRARQAAAKASNPGSQETEDESGN
jgi:hypothetical protein